MSNNLRIKIYDEFDKKVFDFEDAPENMKKKMKKVWEKYK